MPILLLKRQSLREAFQLSRNDYLIGKFHLPASADHSVSTQHFCLLWDKQQHRALLLVGPVWRTSESEKGVTYEDAETTAINCMYAHLSLHEGWTKSVFIVHKCHRNQ